MSDNQAPAEDARIKDTKQRIEALYVAEKITSSEADRLLCNVRWLEWYLERRRTNAVTRWWQALLRLQPCRATHLP